MALTLEQRQKLTDEVLETLAMGIVPDCPSCHEQTDLAYIGLVADIPTFFCRRCSVAFGVDLCTEVHSDGQA